jgi:hypothetical protein
MDCLFASVDTGKQFNSYPVKSGRQVIQNFFFNEVISKKKKTHWLPQIQRFYFCDCGFGRKIRKFIRQVEPNQHA